LSVDPTCNRDVLVPEHGYALMAERRPCKRADPRSGKWDATMSAGV